MATLNIHWETFDDESFNRVKELTNRGFIAISIAPYQIPIMPKKQIEWLKQLFSKPNYVLGQQGLNHKCEKCASFHREKQNEKITKSGVDSWHENYCLWFGPIEERRQEKFMREGRKQLQEIFGKEPELYVPPNNIYDGITIKLASKFGYKWLSDRAKIPLRPYSHNGIIIIPESDPEIKGNNQFYIHADRWKGDLEEVIKQRFESYYELKPSKVDKEHIAENRKLKVTDKIARDLRVGFKMPEEEAKRASQLLFSTKFINDLIL